MAKTTRSNNLLTSTFAQLLSFSGHRVTKQLCLLNLRQPNLHLTPNAPQLPSPFLGQHVQLLPFQISHVKLFPIKDLESCQSVLIKSPERHSKKSLLDNANLTQKTPCIPVKMQANGTIGLQLLRWLLKKFLQNKHSGFYRLPLLFLAFPSQLCMHDLKFTSELNSKH